MGLRSSNTLIADARYCDRGTAALCRVCKVIDVPTTTKITSLGASFHTPSSQLVCCGQDIASSYNAGFQVESEMQAGHQKALATIYAAMEAEFAQMQARPHSAPNQSCAEQWTGPRTVIMGSCQHSAIKWTVLCQAFCLACNALSAPHVRWAAAGLADVSRFETCDIMAW